MMLTEGIPFIVEGKQMFLPFMGMLLADNSERKMKAYEEALMGTTQEVLMEEAIEKDGETYQVGHTKEYVKISVKSEENLSNQIVYVELKNRSQIIH